jgi:fibronectin-binding autotransporter adhesin
MGRNGKLLLMLASMVAVAPIAARTQASGVAGGAISATTNLTIGTNGEIVLMPGANTYSGTTTVSGGTLAMGANNALASASTLSLSGGTLSLEGYKQTLASTLSLTASSTISFSAGTEPLSYANSSGVSWAAGTTLNLVGYAQPAGGDLYVGAGGLTAAQLADIELNGAYINSSGFVAPGPSATAGAISEVPEPDAGALLVLGGLLFAAAKRKPKP